MSDFHWENKIPGFKADLSGDVTYLNVFLSGHRPNEITIVVVGHFLTEYLLDKIILGKLKRTNKIINLSFSIKLDLLNSMALLPEDVNKNIKKLNIIRNKLIHNLELNLLEKDMIFYKTDGKMITVIRSKTKNQKKFYLKLLTNGVLVGLRNHMLTRLRISPNFSERL